MKLIPVSTALLLAATTCLSAADAVMTAAPAESPPTDTGVVGHTNEGLATPMQQLVTPTGKLVPLAGIRPNALALSPDGRLLVTSGLKPQLLVLSPESGDLRQTVPFPYAAQRLSTGVSEAGNLERSTEPKLSFTGLSFAPDGSRLYLSNVNGDIKVFAVDANDRVTALATFALPAANAPERQAEIPAGLAVSSDGRRLYVALNLSNRLAELDAKTGTILRTWNTGVAPFEVKLAGEKAYVSNWGGRRPSPHDVSGDAGRGTFVRVDDRSIASEGSITVIDLKSSAEREILTGLAASGLALSPDGRELVVANSGSDTLTVLDTQTDTVIETLSARHTPADLFGAQPNALAFDASGEHLYVCNGTQNAVAVFDFAHRALPLGRVRYHAGETRMIGLIPVGWYPAAVLYDGTRRQLCVANLKDIATKPEHARKGHGTGFNTKQYTGSISLVPLPRTDELAPLTRRALDNLRYPLLARAALPARTNQPPRPVPERVGEPSVFHHVIYIIKENRTFDQVLGDAGSNGDPELCTFGAKVTPNQHKLVHEFVLLDNTYCCTILSADGHMWTDSAIANDYMERSYAGWPRSYGADSLAYSPAGFIWNDARQHGVSVVNFGEFTDGVARWKDSAQRAKPRVLDCLEQDRRGGGKVRYSTKLVIPALAAITVPDYPGWNLAIPDQSRATAFIRHFRQMEADGSFPALSILWLPNDHTSGTNPGAPTPVAQVADNDRALGRIIETVSHSRYWRDTCIFAIEDDPQDGWDHLSAYRTTAYVVSTYTRRGAVVHVQYNQTSILRTIELMLGLPPMNQMDATATPMTDCFTDAADFAVYDAVPNQVPLDATNPAAASIIDPVLRRDALASAQLPLDREDQCPEAEFNLILWHATKGSRVAYPHRGVTSPVEDDD